MRTLILATLTTLVVGQDAAAQHRAWGRRPVASPYAESAIAPPPRFPRLAAFALPAMPRTTGGYHLPGYYNGRPLARVLPMAVEITWAVLSFLDPVGLNATGTAAPIAIRALHVLLNGSPTPGYPGQTLLFIGNSFAAEARARLTQGVGLRGPAYPLGGVPPVIVPAAPDGYHVAGP